MIFSMEVSAFTFMIMIERITRFAISAEGQSGIPTGHGSRSAGFCRFDLAALEQVVETADAIPTITVCFEQ